MRSMRAWVAASTMAFSAVPASADWQYTRWGMAPDEVRAASGDVARANDDRRLDAAGRKALLTAPWESAALRYTAVFLFDARNRLETVTLNPVGGVACPAIVQTLGARHGAPEGRADMVHAKTLRWDDVDNDNLIVYLDLGHGDCTIQFSKLPPTTPNGKNL